MTTNGDPGIERQRDIVLNALEKPTPALRGEALTTTAKRRGLDAPKLIKVLRGDLDWIVMKSSSLTCQQSC